MAELADLFAEQQTTMIDWGGGPVHGLYELPTEITDLSVRFVRAVPSPPQGLKLKVRGGTLTINATSSTDMVLWEDTAPGEVRVRVAWKPRAKRSLRLWNAWRVNDVTQAWLRSAGMRVEQGPDDSLTFRCSDGVGEPTFDDLVAEVSFG